MKPILFRHRLEYAAVRCVAPLIRLLPRSMALRFGRRVGALSRLLLPGRRKLAEDNVRQAFPEWSQGQVKALVRRNFQQLGMSAVDFLRFEQFDPDNIKEFFDVEGAKHLREAQNQERGVILLTAHFGFWEAGNFIFPALGVPLDTIAKPLKNRLTDAYFYKIRRQFGADIVNSRKGARRILQSLQSGRAIGLLLDQHISPPGSVQVDFFGRKAYTTTAITNMAMKYRIPVVPTFCMRQPDQRFRVWFEPMMMLEGQGEEALVANTQRLSNVMETAIRCDPGQWFWVHKRWRETKTKK
ncbi:MAG: lysophospholipid acyltransferase family protein [Pelovirga sp.]